MKKTNIDVYKELIKKMVDEIDNLQFLIRIYSFVKSKYDRRNKED